MPQELEITLNGETCSLLTPVTLHEMIRNLGLDEDAVAIERNRELSSVRTGKALFYKQVTRLKLCIL